MCQDSDAIVSYCDRLQTLRNKWIVSNVQVVHCQQMPPPQPPCVYKWMLMNNGLNPRPEPIIIKRIKALEVKQVRRNISCVIRIIYATNFSPIEFTGPGSGC